MRRRYMSALQQTLKRQHLGKKIMREHVPIISTNKITLTSSQPFRRNKQIIRMQNSCFSSLSVGGFMEIPYLVWLIFHLELNNSSLNIPITLSLTHRLFYSTNAQNLLNVNLTITNILYQLTILLNFNSIYEPQKPISSVYLYFQTTSIQL